MISAYVSREVCFLLKHMNRQSKRNDLILGLIADPLARSRRDLALVGEHLSDTAKVLDARQLRNSSPHPMSTLLRAVSRSVRQFLKNEQSLADTVSPDIVEMLTMTLGILSAHPDQGLFGRLADKTRAFDKNGDPTVDLVEKRPGRFAIMANSTLTGIPRIALAVTSIAGMVVIVIVVILAFRHEMGARQLLPYLKP